MDLRHLAGAAILLVVAGIVTSIGAEIVSNIRDDQDSNSYERNISTDALDALDNLGEWLPTIGLVVAATIVIGIIVRYFAGKTGL